VYTVITENDTSEWNNDTGLKYPFPKRYLKLIQPGVDVVYYKGRLRNKEFSNRRLSNSPHYFATAKIGSVVHDPEIKKGDLIANIINFIPFDKPMLAKNNSEYLEKIPENRKTNYWRDGVRGIDETVFKLFKEDEDKHSNIIHIFRSELSDKLAASIAQNPRYLDKIEWRELERVVQHIFEELGFESELTPGSKDGGKDVIIKFSVNNKKHKYFIELKHWRSGKKVGSSVINEFFQVVINEEVDGGIFLSSSGYSDKAFSSLTGIHRQHLQFGDENKIYSLCQKYVLSKSGFLSPSEDMVSLLHENTY
jgi:hypothetical protein